MANNIKCRADIPDLWHTTELMRRAGEIILNGDPTEHDKGVGKALIKQANDVADVWSALHKALEVKQIRRRQRGKTLDSIRQSQGQNS